MKNNLDEMAAVANERDDIWTAASTGNIKKRERKKGER